MQITGVLLRKDNTHSSRSYPISTANSTKTTAVSIFLQVIEPFRRNYTSTLRTNFAKQLSGTETKQYPTVPVPLTETSWRNRRTQLRSSARTPVHREYRQKWLFFRFFFLLLIWVSYNVISLENETKKTIHSSVWNSGLGFEFKDTRSVCDYPIKAFQFPPPNSPYWGVG